ncbi:MAG: J domain-containing protein [Comamonadaceae bacterium]|nr:MAG: J domain-containing protein [Comamonadaceae bacterium]
MKRSAPDHYATLHISRDASPEAVRRAWRRLAQKFHPDRHRGAGDAAARMAGINVAYGVLSDPQSRQRYDSDLDAAMHTHTPAGAGGASTLLPVMPAWSWALLVAVLSVTLLTLGLVALRSRAPLAAPPPAPLAAAQPVRVAETEPLVPAKPIPPWTEPEQRQALTSPETEPVARLVREGTLHGPAPRRRDANAP